MSQPTADPFLLKLGVHTRDCTCLRPDWTVASQSGRDSSAYTVTTRSRPSDSLKTADLYAPWCHLVFRHASVTTAVVIGWYLKTGASRFSRRIGCNVSRPGRNTVASDAWPSFKARRRWIGAKSLVCTPGFRPMSPALYAAPLRTWYDVYHTFCLYLRNVNGPWHFFIFHTCWYHSV